MVAKLGTNLKKISYDQQGDRIVICLIDMFNNTFFKGSANTNNRKEMLKLRNELESKGVSFGKKGWFD